MKIIITMAGEGSRFKKVGYKVPKHEIEVKGKSLFEWSMLSLKNFFDENFIFIVRENNYDKEKLECLCNKLGIKNFKLKEIKELTDGQASTAYLCNEYILEDEDVLIYNIDTYISGDEIKKEELKKYDGYIPVFKSEGDKWSFVKLDDNGKVIDVVEKIRVSDLGSIGLYYFKTWRDYKEIYLKYKEEIKRKYKEVYIAPMYHYLLKENKDIGYIILKNENIHVLGTPEDLEVFKKNKKKLVLLYEPFELQKEFLYKDVILMPYYLGKEYNLDVDIVYFNNQYSINNFRNLNFKKLKKSKYYKWIGKFDKLGIINNIFFIKYLIEYAKKIDYLMLFHLSFANSFLIRIYKFFNQKGKVYIKLDINKKTTLKNIQNNFLKRKLFCEFKYIDLISCETEENFILFKENGYYGKNIKEKITCVSNGVDEEYLIENKIEVKKYEEKENIILTVGRLGTKEKNNELLLETLEKIDLRDWKVLLIGPYTEEFKKLYDNFIERNQDKKNKVVLVGNISDRSLLYDYYNRAKVFILTSRWESFGIVLVEALRLGNYIITTDVGGARDITENGKIGSIIEVGNSKQLQNEIRKVIDNKVELEKKYNESLKLSNEKFLWSNIVKNKKFVDFFEEEFKKK